MPSACQKLPADPPPPNCSSWQPTLHHAHRFALVLYGSVGPANARMKSDQLFRAGADLSPNHFVDVAFAKEHLFAHLMEPSGGVGEFDVFLHSTVPSLSMRHLLLNLYRPVASRFDDAYLRIWRRRIDRIIKGRNASAGGFSTPAVEVSRYVSAAAALRLVQEAEDARGSPYAAIYLTRPDVLLWAKVDLRTYCVDEAVYTNNCHPPFHVFHGKHGCPADFHFVLSSPSARRFSTITDHMAEYDYFAESPKGFDDSKNRLMMRFVRDVVGVQVRHDHVVAARHEEVMRKVHQQKDWYADWCRACASVPAMPRCRHTPLVSINVTAPLPWYGVRA